MDKLSAVIAGAVCMVLSIGAGAAYTVWGGGSEQFAVPASSEDYIEEEIGLTHIAMNDDSQIINGGGQDMWVRAKIQSSDRKDLDAACFHLISDTVKSEPDADQRKAGIWIPDEDGYFYYSLPVSPGEQSKPLFQSIEETDCDAEGFCIRAEGVQINWTEDPSENGQAAFEQFDRQYKSEHPVDSYKGIFI